LLVFATIDVLGFVEDDGRRPNGVAKLSR